MDLTNQPQTTISAITPEYRECFKCKFRGFIEHDRCPNCGRRLYTARNIRIRGIVLVLLGVFIVFFISGIALFVARLLSNAMKDPAAARKINAGSGTFLAIYGLFGLLAVFGLHSVIIGTWQIAFGKRNRPLIWIMWALLFALLGCGIFVSVLVGN